MQKIANIQSDDTDVLTAIEIAEWLDYVMKEMDDACVPREGYYLYYPTKMEAVFKEALSLMGKNMANKGI